MKTFIFLTGGVEGINGAIIYLLNKKIYLEKNGWNVIILYHGKGEVFIPEFKECQGYFEFLKYYPSSFNKRILPKKINGIKQQFNELTQSSEICIESHNFRLACWGEYLAEKFNAQHIFLLVRENPKIETKEYFEFMKFKYETHSLYGMSSNTLQLLFKDYMDIPVDKALQMETPCDNTVQDVESKWINLVNQDVRYNVCTIGRLEKKYLVPMIKEIEKFAIKFNRKIDLYIIAGAYNKNSEELILELLEGCDLVTGYVTGFTYPVPLKLLHKMDMAICCAGSVLTTHNAGLPTVAIDVLDLEPIGIYGYTTYNTHYRSNNQEKVAYEDVIKSILVNKEAENLKLIPRHSDMNNIFKEHLLIHRRKSNSGYYNITTITNEGGHYKRRMTISKIIGPQNYEKIQNIKGKILNG